MRELSQRETSLVAAGELTCTVGVRQDPCLGTTDVLTTEWLIGAVTDLMEKLADWWKS